MNVPGPINNKSKTDEELIQFLIYAAENNNEFDNTIQLESAKKSVMDRFAELRNAQISNQNNHGK